jgi:acyl transferase domain-containing protein
LLLYTSNRNRVVPHANGHENHEHIDGIPKRESYLLTFSAHSDASLHLNIDQVKARAESYRPDDLAFTLGARRTHFHHRAFATVTAGVNYETAFKNILYGTIQLQEPRIGFVFTGKRM